MVLTEVLSAAGHKQVHTDFRAIAVKPGYEND
jgi:hypothetical protein